MWGIPLQRCGGFPHSAGGKSRRPRRYPRPRRRTISLNHFSRCFEERQKIAKAWEEVKEVHKQIGVLNPKVRRPFFDIRDLFLLSRDGQVSRHRSGR